MNVLKHDLLDGNQPDHLYVDISIINNSDEPKPIVFQDLRNQAIIENSGDYYCFIARFHLDTFDSLPLYIPQIDTSQSDPNKSIYSFTLKYKSYVCQAFMEFVSQNPSEPTPAAPNVNGQDMSSKYYFVYSYAYVIGLFNATLQTAFNGLHTLVTAGSDSLPTTYAPWFLYDPTSSDIILNADVAGYDESLENPIQLYMNNAMLTMFSSFEYINYGSSALNGCNYLIKIYNNNGTNVLEMTNYNCLQMYQEYNSTANWNPVQSVLLVSSMLPIQPTIVSQPTQFNSISRTNQSNQNVTMNIITDFEVGLTSGKEYLPSINMLPFVYRLIDCFGHSDIKNINIRNLHHVCCT